MNILGVDLVGETNDVKAQPTSTNIVIKTDNGFKLFSNAVWNNWEFCIIFPDKEKAEYFLKNFKSSMNDYREGMLKDDYFFHIVHFKYPKPKQLYADQLRMKKDWSFD
jgi:hypothetical protein